MYISKNAIIWDTMLYRPVKSIKVLEKHTASIFKIEEYAKQFANQEQEASYTHLENTKEINHLRVKPIGIKGMMIENRS
jgi:hypothetical protein